MADEEKAGVGPESKFGNCCEELKEAIAGEDFEPLINVGPEGILYMAVGLIELEDDEPGMVDHPLFYCPFCWHQAAGCGNRESPARERGRGSAVVGSAAYLSG